MRDRDPFGPDTPLSRAVDFAEFVDHLARFSLSPCLKRCIEKWNYQRSIDRPLPSDKTKIFK